MPYIAWSEDGVFGFPVAAVLLLGRYVSELFGHKAGKELPQAWPFERLGYHHAGARPGKGCQACRGMLLIAHNFESLRVATSFIHTVADSLSQTLKEGMHINPGKALRFPCAAATPTFMSRRQPRCRT